MAQKLDPVQLDAVYTERIRKEQEHQKLHTEFSINPYRKLHILPDKPMTRKPTEMTPQNEVFINALRKAHQVPTKKYPLPITESHEIGWLTDPLVPNSRQDTRFNFYRFTTDVTRHHEFGQRANNAQTQKRENKN